LEKVALTVLGTEEEVQRKRSLLMARVRREHSRPERAVRKYLHRAGFRYRLHDRRLPGTPDIVFPRFRCVIFVNGCFWHRHPDCRRASMPKTRIDFWLAKFQKNVSRDKAAASALERLGWRVIVVWECETRDPEVMHVRLKSLFLQRTRVNRVNGEPVRHIT
jgi:DNA mismatch endonuclease (patch repair protein)